MCGGRGCVRWARRRQALSYQFAAGRDDPDHPDGTSERQSLRPSACAAPSRVPGGAAPGDLRDLLDDAALRALHRDGLLVLDGVLDPAVLHGARAEADSVLESGFLEDPMQPIRSDRMMFVSEYACRQHDCPALAAAVRRLHEVGDLLDGKTWEAVGPGAARRQVRAAGSKPLQRVPLRCPEEVMLATYGVGARYLPHRDNVLSFGPDAIEAQSRICIEDPFNGNARHLTMVLYLNEPDRCLQQGGCLRCHLAARWSGEAGADKNVGACEPDCRGGAVIGGGWGGAQVHKPQKHCHLDVLPVGGRVVIFFARELLHEVCPSRERRWALTLWADDLRLPPKDAERYMMQFNQQCDARFVQELLKKSPPKTIRK